MSPLLQHYQKMTKQKITHIKKIEIKKLWGKYDVSWELDPKVNILIGINGSGKSTILDLLYRALNEHSDTKLWKLMKSINITFNNGERYKSISNLNDKQNKDDFFLKSISEKKFSKKSFLHEFRRFNGLN